MIFLDHLRKLIVMWVGSMFLRLWQHPLQQKKTSKSTCYSLCVQCIYICIRSSLPLITVHGESFTFFISFTSMVTGAVPFQYTFSTCHWETYIFYKTVLVLFYNNYKSIYFKRTMGQKVILMNNNQVTITSSVSNVFYFSSKAH